jgi:hypothetical protein
MLPQLPLRAWLQIDSIQLVSSHMRACLRLMLLTGMALADNLTLAYLLRLQVLLQARSAPEIVSNLHRPYLHSIWYPYSFSS